MERRVERERVERRLAAILAADVVGYSRLIGTDDEGTLARLKAHHDALVAPKIKQHRGRIVRTTGDGLLVLFASVVDAVRCALEVQGGMAERNAQGPRAQRIELRIGIDVGDIIIDGRSIHGDGVNVAARLEALAEPGGICVSGRVREDVQGKFDVAFEDAGEQRLKNILRPVRVYRLREAASPLVGQTSVFPGTSQSHAPPAADGNVGQAAARPLPSLRLFAIYAITPIIVLLLAHYLIVLKFDLNPVFLRVFSLLLPVFVGFVMSRQTGHGLGTAFLLGATIAIASVLGMLALVGLIEPTNIIPSSRMEWQESVEYGVGITLATMVGSALARANSALSAIRGH
jgi:class 3 adenylate cyclase